jgi:pimeloyl-ACP methyl ester carboxylesterase
MQRAPSADGTSIAYERHGKGAPLVIVGGGFTDRHTADALAALLAPDFTVVTYDRRGRGDSGDAEHYAPQREVEDLAAVIEACGAPAHLYGHSSGALIALRAAANGIPIARLALYEPAFSVGADITDRLRALLQRGDRTGTVTTFLEHYVGVPPDQIARMRDEDPGVGRLVVIAPTLVYEATLMGDGAIPLEAVGRIAVPALVLAGGDSGPEVQRSAAELAAAMPGARLETVPGQGHGVAPEAVAPVLRRFLAVA